MRWTRALAVLVIVIGVAGCSGSDADDSEPKPEPKSSPSTKDSSSDDVRGGVASPDSLSAFECAPDDDGSWRASGEITNTGDDAEDFRVTIMVAPPTAAGRGDARELTIADVGGGDSEKFAAKKLPVVTGDAPTCSVQVARLTA